MRFVNLTRRYVCSSFAGNVAPGAVTSEGGKRTRHLEEALAEVVKACGDRLGIRLNEREADLLNKLIGLDEKGSAFDPSTIPAEIRNDPTGAARASQKSYEAQMAEMDRIARANDEGLRREAEINGETLKPNPRAHEAPEGDKVKPSDLKSGFERIMEENARIAAQGKPDMDVAQALDPIGANAVKKGESNGPAEVSDEGRPNPDAVVTPEPVKDVPGDVARNADAAIAPVPQAQNPKNAMDRQAAEMAKGLSVLSALDNPPKAKGKKGKGASKGAKAK